MEPVATKVLDGLLEGLVLHAINEDPSHGYGILKDLEGAMGEAPNKNRVYRLLRELEEEGYVASEEITEDSRSRQVYALTGRGDERLAAYRQLPGPFKAWLSGLFDVEAIGAAEEQAAEGPQAGEVDDQGAGQAGPREADGTPAADGWVQEQLDRLPAGSTIEAPHASFSLERMPGESRWQLTVERHRPGEYAGAEACGLTFIYAAIHRLLYEQPPR